MRYIALSLLVASSASALSLPLAAGPMKSPATENKQPVVVAAATSAEPQYGVLEETPNQRRRRLGQPIVDSYPPLNYGELIETPNHRRKRLGLPLPAESEPEAQNVKQEKGVQGAAVETPNHYRKRLVEQYRIIPAAHQDAAPQNQ